MNKTDFLNLSYIHMEYIITAYCTISLAIRGFLTIGRLKKVIRIYSNIIQPFPGKTCYTLATVEITE
jgi:hypothetical protein